MFKEVPVARKVKASSSALGDLPTKMIVAKKAKLADRFGDLFIYRNLEPLDKQIQGLKKAAGKMGISGNSIPRKHDDEYAAATVWFIEEAQRLRGAAKNIKELLVIGDSLYNDGQAFQNVRELSRWYGSCFIGSEDLEEKASGALDAETNIYESNRWAALTTWMAALLENGLQVGEETAIIIDIDKTLIGARGRNDSMINEARLQGIYSTMDSVLGSGFDKAAFERQFTELSQSKYNSLTEDNLDYLVYICLTLNAKLVQLDELIGQVESGSINNFAQFARWVHSTMMIKSGAGERLRQVHESIMTGIHVGDPTPFKRLREKEFIATAAHMGNVPDSMSVIDMLDEEIVITYELMQLAEWLQARGCLILCISDKPSESACPDPQVTSDLLPLHQIRTHSVGTDIGKILKAL